MSHRYRVELLIEVGEAGPRVEFVRIMTADMEPTSFVTRMSTLLAPPEPKPRRKRRPAKEPK